MCESFLHVEELRVGSGPRDGVVGLAVHEADARVVVKDDLVSAGSGSGSGLSSALSVCPIGVLRWLPLSS